MNITCRLGHALRQASNTPCPNPIAVSAMAINTTGSGKSTGIDSAKAVCTSCMTRGLTGQCLPNTLLRNRKPRLALARAAKSISTSTSNKLSSTAISRVPVGISTRCVTCTAIGGRT